MKRVKTKSQKVLRANSYVCGNYRRKTGRGKGGFLPPPPILNRINSMLENPDKFQIMLLGSNNDNSKFAFMIKNKRVKSRSDVKLLGITKDDKLSFSIHIENLCSTASNRLRA